MATTDPETRTDWRDVASETAAFARRVGWKPLALLLGAVCAIAVVAFLAGVRYGAPAPVELPLASADAPPPVATTAPSMLQVHLAGAVQRPGLSEVPAGYRVGDLLDAADGTHADADLAAVNLAERLRDGQQVYVPRQGEQSPAGFAGSRGATGATSSALIDVNTATASQLEELPGIGPALAARIVDYRDEHGPFATLDALERVPGIGPSKLAQLRPHATV